MPVKVTNFCKHYRSPDHNKTCSLGIAFNDVTPEPERLAGLFWRMPCHRGIEPTNAQQAQELKKRGSCDKFEQYTADDLKEMQRDAEERIEQIHDAISTINMTGLSVGTIKCPRCGSLDLRFEVFSNGRIWGKCPTKGCLSWME